MTREEWQKEMSELEWEFAILEDHILKTRERLLMTLKWLLGIEGELRDYPTPLGPRHRA